MNEVKRNKYALPLNLQTFSEPDPEPTDPPADPEPKPLTMTQEELDALIAKRLGQERKKYADYDDIKTKLSEHEKAEADRKLAAMSEQERLQAEVDAAKKVAEDAEKAKQQTLDIVNQRIIKSEIKLAAANVNIRPDALEDVFVLVDKSGISVDEQGNAVGVEDAVKALIERKPYLIEVKQTQKPKVIGDPNNPKEEERKTLQAQLDEAKKRKDFSKVIELSNKLTNLS